MEFAIGMILGLLVGIGLTWALLAMRARAMRADRAELEEKMRDVFQAVASAALDANGDRLGKQAAGLLEGKKALIDQSVRAIDDRLSKLSAYFNTIEKERKTEFGRLSESVGTLATTTGELHRMLASKQRRGAWGERMAEDILRLAGLMEGVNYRKQSTADAEEKGRPDFTFLLPNDLAANMDVKFPLESYKSYLDAETDEARTAARAQLVRDVKKHVETLAGRDYISAQTVQYVLLFLPSEQMYSLVLEAVPDLIDEALRKKVVLTSPLTLYAMLAVIRQAAESANLMKTADEVLRLLAAFRKQWQMYNEELDKLGRHIESTSKQYEEVSGRRTNMLRKQLDKIEDLSQQRGLEEIAPEE